MTAAGAPLTGRTVRLEVRAHPFDGGWEERASEIVAADRATITDLVSKHFGSDTALESPSGRTSP